jgi:MATE family multidrug resistance protein
MTTAMRHYLQGRNILLPTLLVMVVGNGINAFANWVLIFGHLGVPALGLEGAAIATALSRLSICALLATAILKGKLHQGAWVPWSRSAFDLRALSHVLSVGVPIGIQLVLEVGAFTVATLIAGRLGEVALGAHTVVLNLASVTFMLPLGVSIAAATRIGNLVGAGELTTMRQSIRTAFALGIGTMGLCGVVFIMFPSQLPLLYSHNVALIALAASVLPIAAAFQVFDGTQVVGSGVLRGMGRTSAPALTHIVGFYGIGLPLGYYLTFNAGYGLQGLWWGLALALVCIAVTLTTWTLRASHHPIRV